MRESYLQSVKVPPSKATLTNCQGGIFTPVERPGRHHHHREETPTTSPRSSLQDTERGSSHQETLDTPRLSPIRSLQQHQRQESRRQAEEGLHGEKDGEMQQPDTTWVSGVKSTTVRCVTGTAGETSVDGCIVVVQGNMLVCRKH